MPDSDYVEVVLVTYSDDEVLTETPWAEPVGGDLYRLKNFPFYGYGISYDDVFSAAPIFEEEGDDRLYLIEVVEKSGYRTLRVILKESAELSKESRQILFELEGYGCDFESSNGRYFAVNIKPESDFGAICDYLTSKSIQWEHGDPEYEKLHGASA